MCFLINLLAKAFQLKDFDPFNLVNMILSFLLIHLANAYKDNI